MEAAASAAAETATPAAAAATARAAAAAATAVASVASKSDLLSLLFYSTLTAAFCELIGYFLIYRREDYQRYSSNFIKASKRLEKKREEPAPPPKGSGKPTKDKKLLSLEREFEIANRDLISLKSRAGMLTATVQLMAFFSLKTSYDGIVLAKLPFAPFSFLQGVTHRNLPGSDPTDCGMIFLYMLCSMTIKPNLQRALGHAPPKTAIPAGAQRLAEKWSGIKASDLR